MFKSHQHLDFSHKCAHTLLLTKFCFFISITYPVLSMSGKISFSSSLASILHVHQIYFPHKINSTLKIYKACAFSHLTRCDAFPPMLDSYLQSLCLLLTVSKQLGRSGTIAQFTSWVKCWKCIISKCMNHSVFTRGITNWFLKREYTS